MSATSLPESGECLSETRSADVSPDSKCSICLDTLSNIAYLDSCLHKFCFCCIQEWSKNKTGCPLCKQAFKVVYHSIKSATDFKRYDPQASGNDLCRRSTRQDRGMVFEASTNPPQQAPDHNLRHIMRTLAARRKAARRGRVEHSVTEDEVVNFRRELYRQGVRVQSIRHRGRSQDTTAEFYHRNPACLHRLLPWLKRELTVLYGSRSYLCGMAQKKIMSRITRRDMEDGAMEEELKILLGARSGHFLHEFISFAKSPLSMEAYDQHAVYDCSDSSSNGDSSSNEEDEPNSSVDSERRHGKSKKESRKRRRGPNEETDDVRRPSKRSRGHD